MGFLLSLIFSVNCFGSILNFSKDSRVSVLNDTETPLNASASWTGSWESSHDKPSIQFGVKTDQAGELCADFRSPSGSIQATVSTLCYDVAANINEFHTLGLAGREWRLRFENTSSSNQTELDVYSAVGNFGVGTAPANLTLGQDADALAVRTFDPSIEIVQGLRAGWSIAPKQGKNQDIDSGTLPETVWENGGVYTGFPTGAPEKLECFSSSASDTGTLTIGGILASSDSTEHISETITLSGTTPIDTLTDVYRAHTMRYSSGSATGFNIGTITCRHTTTTANVFLSIPIGQAQSNAMVFTCPAGKTCHIKRLFGSIRRGTAATIDGGIWFRSFGGSPRYRRPFTITQGAIFELHPYGSIVFPAKSDIRVDVTFASTNNIAITFGMDIIQIIN